MPIRPCLSYLKGLSPGLRCLVTSSKCLPFLATNSANLIATFSTSGSMGARGPEGAGQEAQRRGQKAGCNQSLALVTKASFQVGSKSMMERRSNLLVPLAVSLLAAGPPCRRPQEYQRPQGRWLWLACEGQAWLLPTALSSRLQERRLALCLTSCGATDFCCCV